MAGHSKWANIKHKKARQDAKRGKAWSKCAKAIMVAAKQGGDNPDANLALRYAIEEAKAVNMPKDTIANAIRKGTGEADGESYESGVYEGYGPGGVAIMLEILTDNRNRTAADIRKLFENHGGNLGESGCVAYLFQRKGQILIPKEEADEETVMAASLEAGAEDVVEQDEGWQVLCDPGDFLDVRTALEEIGLKFEDARITMIPDTTIEVDGSEARKTLRLVEALEDHDDVQKVHANFDITEEQAAAVEQS